MAAAGGSFLVGLQSQSAGRDLGIGAHRVMLTRWQNRGHAGKLNEIEC